MILYHILIAFCFILAILIVGIVIGAMLRSRRIDRENKEMEAILKKYGKDKTDRASRGDAGRRRDGGDLPHRL